MKLLVTGANGFVGAAVIERLKDLADLTLIAGPRGQTPPRLRHLRWIQQDLREGDSLDRLVQGQDVILHLAGLAHVARDGPGDDWARFYATNVVITEHLAHAAARQGVKRFVLMSSGAINGVETYGRPFQETDPANPSSHYGLSKLRAEEAVQRACAGTEMQWVALRPPVLVGPRTPGNIAAVMRLIDRNIPVPLAAIKNRRSYLGLRNFADLVALSLHHPAAANEVFLSTDEPSLSTPALFSLLARQMGRSPRLFAVPTPLIKAAAATAGRTSALRPLWATLELDASKAVTRLGWERSQPLEEALGEAARSFLTEKARS